MKNHVLTPEAQTNLLDIIDFIAADSPTAADRVLAEFEQAFELIGNNPDTSHYRDDLLNRKHRFHSVFLFGRVPMGSDANSDHRHRAWCP